MELQTYIKKNGFTPEHHANLKSYRSKKYYKQTTTREEKNAFNLYTRLRKYYLREHNADKYQKLLDMNYRTQKSWRDRFHEKFKCAMVAEYLEKGLPKVKQEKKEFIRKFFHEQGFNDEALHLVNSLHKKNDRKKVGAPYEPITPEERKAIRTYHNATNSYKRLMIAKHIGEDVC